MKKNMKALLSQFQPFAGSMSPARRLKVFKNRKQSVSKNQSRDMSRSNQHKKGDSSSMAKYQSYIQFINEDKIQINSNSKTFFAGRKINPFTSKTPILENSLIIDQQIQRRRSMLERKRLSPYMQKPINMTIKNQKQKSKIKIKRSFSRKKKLNYSQDQKASKSRKQEQSQQELQRVLFDGIQFFRDLGKGAHAVVRSAIDWKTKRKIAVKVYKKDDLNYQQLESIKSEILILRSIKHPNIASLYNVIETLKTINLVLEYGGGNSLFQHIKNKPSGYFTESEAKPIFKQILEAMAYLHQKDIVHRDIKPQNILINKANQVKVIDFGFSLFSGLHQKVSSYCGTITYMAPQVVNKKPHVGIYSDRWSLGVLLYTIIQGAFPFPASTQKQLFSKISKGVFKYVNNISKQASNLIESFIIMKPVERISAKQALQSEWFKMKV